MYGWGEYLTKLFSEQVDVIVEALFSRVLPAFNNIEMEAEEAAKNTFRELSAGMGYEGVVYDSFEIAEKAEVSGYMRYEALAAAQQSMLNCTAVALYHLFEQQVQYFLQDVARHPAQEPSHKKTPIAILEKAASSKGIDIASLEMLPAIKELRLLANAIKHAHGPSAEKLYKLRPDLFSREDGSTSTSMLAFADKKLLPLAGVDIYVSTTDIRRYADGVKSFWHEVVIRYLP